MGLTYTTGDGTVLSTSYSGIALEPICALIGNAMQESGCNPGIWNGAQQISYSSVTSSSFDTAFGCFQWYGGRRRSLGSKANNLDATVYNLAFQLWYLEQEEGWLGTSNGISSVSEFLTDTTTSLYNLTYAFLACWERPSTDSDELAEYAADRYEYALSAYNYLSDDDNRDDRSSGDFYYGYNYFTTSQSQYNWPYIYAWFNGSSDPSSGGGTNIGGGSGGSGNSNFSSTTSYLAMTKPYRKLMPQTWTNRRINYRRGK